MNRNKVLFEIKSLEKILVRYMFNDFNINNIPSPTQMQIMNYMFENNLDYVYQKDLENVLNLRRATVSGVLQTMEKNGLLKRVIDSDDTRVKKVILNPETKKKFAQRKEKLLILENLITKNISNSELETFYIVIDKMKNNIKEYNNEGRQ